MITTKKILMLFLKPLFLILCFTFQTICSQTDTITSNISITDPDFVVSNGNMFRLGFFTTPVNTTNRYLGISYVVSERTVVWVANRNNPLTDSSGTVTISENGDLILINGRNETIWSTNATTAPVNTMAQILDTGNLVLHENSTGNIIWESFSNPTSYVLPNQRLTDNVITGHRVRTWSWRNVTDPTEGDFRGGIVALNIPQIFCWRNGSPYYRTGPWNGFIFIGVQDDLHSPYVDRYRLGNDSGEYYFMTPQQNFLMNFEVNSSGSFVQHQWDDQNQNWDIIWVAPQTQCDVYGTCGHFGNCNPLNSPICDCLRGFEPVDADAWGSGNWTSGCMRRRELECDGENNRDGFLRMPNMKVPDFAEQFSARVVDECRGRCLRNCSCLAYSFDPNIGCMFWRETLIDVQQFDGVGRDLYIRLASSELDDNNDRMFVIIIPVVVGFVAVSICLFIAWWWMGKKKGKKITDQMAVKENPALQSDSTAIVLIDESKKINVEELPLFSFKTLADATNQFHQDNMLGRGGFGFVYKGKLANGKDIAVKRLSEASVQGAREFRNEAVVISKVQHRNLVKILGCCVEREEKMLVYEYMPNKSLDVCLFDPKHPSQKILDWKKRFSIIEGVGRGLLYLHMDSRLKIIHRDLKPSNVLLDGDWIPKISDFGMARIFGGNQDQASTARVVGTYGYMAPEYAMDGRFSEKSDVYSFGVLMLEIVSGKKNTHYYNQEWSLNFLGWAWKLWNEDNGIAFANQTIANPNFEEEIVRCIHIALLCVQEFPKDRPDVQTILSMLGREIVGLPLPEQPVFAEKLSHYHVGSTQTTSQNGYSINELTTTMLEGR